MRVWTKKTILVTAALLVLAVPLSWHLGAAEADRGDARVLADLVRTDRHHHRTVAPDSELLESIKVLARAHQNLIWTRGRQTNALRNALREYYPGALVAFDDLAHPDALAVLAVAPEPERGRKLSQARIVSLLRKGGRRRNLERRAGEIRAALREPQLTAPPLVAEAQAANTVALTAVITTLVEQIARLEAELVDAFGRHPDAEILRSLPGLGDILGARVYFDGTIFGVDEVLVATGADEKNCAVSSASGDVDGLELRRRG